MGKAIGGDITEITANHPTLGSAVFYCKAGENSVFDIGGVSTEEDAQGVDGSGNPIYTLTRKRWNVEQTVAWDMNDLKTLQLLQSYQESVEETDWTFTHINGSVFSGTGKPVGDLVGDGKAATIALKLQGGKKLVQIA